MLTRVTVDSTMLKIEAESEIEVEQGQVFDLEIKCTTSEMEMSHGEIFKSLNSTSNFLSFLPACYTYIFTAKN